MYELGDVTRTRLPKRKPWENDMPVRIQPVGPPTLPSHQLQPPSVPLWTGMRFKDILPRPRLGPPPRTPQPLEPQNRYRYTVPQAPGRWPRTPSFYQKQAVGDIRPVPREKLAYYPLPETGKPAKWCLKKASP